MAEKKITDTLAKLSPEDRKAVEAQRFCPVMEYGRLGAMGAPIKVMVEGKPVFVCCKGCTEDAVEGGKDTLEKVAKLTAASAVLVKLSPEDRTAAEAQKYCAIAEGSFLGSMGAPIKLVMEGKPVFLCCKGCVKKAEANPAATLAKVDALKKAGMDEDHDDAHEHADHKK
ncbi:MAG: hypothetical protein R3C05_28075 [Pirellulaceae bacterium]